jgi:hypothetical protein
MESIKPNTEVYALVRLQPEFREPPRPYINRRVSDWRIISQTTYVERPVRSKTAL